MDSLGLCPQSGAWALCFPVSLRWQPFLTMAFSFLPLPLKEEGTEGVVSSSSCWVNCPHPSSQAAVSEGKGAQLWPHFLSGDVNSLDLVSAELVLPGSWQAGVRQAGGWRRKGRWSPAQLLAQHVGEKCSLLRIRSWGLNSKMGILICYSLSLCWWSATHAWTVGLLESCISLFWSSLSSASNKERSHLFLSGDEVNTQLKFVSVHPSAPSFAVSLPP